MVHFHFAYMYSQNSDNKISVQPTPYEKQHRAASLFVLVSLGVLRFTSDSVILGSLLAENHMG